MCGCKKRLMVVCMKEKKAHGRIKGQSLIENVGCMVALRACKSEWRKKKKRNGECEGRKKKGDINNDRTDSASQTKIIIGNQEKSERICPEYELQGAIISKSQQRERTRDIPIHHELERPFQLEGGDTTPTSPGVSARLFTPPAATAAALARACCPAPLDGAVLVRCLAPSLFGTPDEP